MSTGFIFFLALVPAIILHELAHGYVAHLLGDDTAKSQGRLSLNPADQFLEAQEIEARQAQVTGE